MTPHEFLRLLRTAEGETAERVLDVLKAVAHDHDLVKYAHNKYLPAANQYREYIQGKQHAGVSLAGARRMRGRLGGVSPWMYARQRGTFEDVLKLWIPGWVQTALPRVLQSPVARVVADGEETAFVESRESYRVAPAIALIWRKRRYIKIFGDDRH